MKYITHISILCIVCLLLIAVAACTTDSTPTTEPTAFPTATEEIIPTDTPTTEPSPEPTSTPTETALPPTPTPFPLRLTSKAFRSKGTIPERHAYHGENISPQLLWSDPPDGTASFVLLVFSEPLPDGGGNWANWVLYNIPAETRELPEGIVPDEEGKMPDGSQHLENSWGYFRYGGPTPHGYTTRTYFFQVYALDTILDLTAGEDESDDEVWIGRTLTYIFEAMEGHILAMGELEGKYKGE
ncbi:MAG: YbhB/YbcL family Raf kinase inhibitor-like protein [Anaerolineales bacterium]|nr:YbhB/YbcL family Raf kinase inhibitor-like protein [Anaerolineales bacterium]